MTVTKAQAVGAILTITAVTLAARGVNRQLATMVVAEKQTVRLGDPVKVSVTVSNQGSQVVEADQSATAFDAFEVTDPDGHVLPYVGFDGQVVGGRALRVQPSSTVKVKEAMDLRDSYIFQNAGRYSIRFKGGGGLMDSFPIAVTFTNQFHRGDTGLPGSSVIAVDILPGQLSELDQLRVCLLPLCAESWRLATDGRGEVVPFGRLRAEGFALHLCHGHMQGQAVWLWFTKAESKIDPNPRAHAMSQYMGRGRSLYVYVAVDEHTPPLWPSATKDISRALQIVKE
jgi:hypothetical protein